MNPLANIFGSSSKHYIIKSIMASSAMIRSLFFALALFACGVYSRKLQELSAAESHEQWMAKYRKVYMDASKKEMRLQIFKDNAEFIDAFNAAGDKLYKLSANAFADMTNDEFKASRTGYKRASRTTRTGRTTSFRYENVTAVLATLDRRKKGAVPSRLSRTKDNVEVGAFSTVATTEGINQLITGKLISLPEQELVDCDVNGEDQGCEGVLMEDGFQFIINNKGLTAEANYPYAGTDGTCKTAKEASRMAKITGYEVVPANSKAALLKAVANQPVLVSIDAGGSSFQFYSTGVFTGDCGTYLDHGVMVTGYGTTADGTKYWLVKNSWRESWGEEGYIRMERGIDSKEGLCGIAMDSSYPIV